MARETGIMKAGTLVFVASALCTALAPAAARCAPLVQFVGGLNQSIGDFTPFEIPFLPFDPAQGTLTSVKLELIGTVTPTLFTDNIANASGSFTLTTRLLVTPTNGFPATQTVNVVTQAGIPLTPSSLPPSSFLNGTATAVDQTFTFADTADFLGTSSTPINLLEYGFRTQVTPAITGAGSDLTSFSGRAIITYNVAATTVPEPATLLLLGAGLLGLACARRRLA